MSRKTGAKDQNLLKDIYLLETKNRNQKPVFPNLKAETKTQENKKSNDKICIEFVLFEFTFRG